MPAHTICLLFSNTGGGHRSACDAIEAGIRQIWNQKCADTSQEKQLNIVCDNIIEKTHFIHRFFVEMFNFLLKHNQASMKYYFWLIEQLKPNDSELGYLLARSYLHKTIIDLKPDVIVSVHPMVNQYVVRALKETGTFGKIPLIVVITDPNDGLWHGWACPEADLIIAPNEAARGQLLSWGIPQNKTQVIGMPLHPDFLKPPTFDRQKFLAFLDLDPDVFTVCLNSGWAGGGNLMAMYNVLSKVKKKIQVIFLCGHHHNLYKKVTQISVHSPILTRAFPFHDNMPDLMNAVDLMVTKAGGLTTFEAIARRLPLAIDMITEPMPQEAGTVDILVEGGLAQTVRKPEDIVNIIENTELRSKRKDSPLPTFQNLDHIEAIYDIAGTILNMGGLYSPTAANMAHRTRVDAIDPYDSHDPVSS